MPGILIYFLIAGGAARTAFVPVFTEYLAHGRRREAWRVFSTVFWLLLILGGVVVIGGSLFAPQVARLSALSWLGSAPERVDVCAHIMRIIFPAQLFLVLGSLLMGTLNAHKHCLWPAPGAGPGVLRPPGFVATFSRVFPAHIGQ